MNVAQYLLSIGMRPRPRHTGLPCPALGGRDPVSVFDSEMGGNVYVRDANGQTMPDTSRSKFSKTLKEQS